MDKIEKAFNVYVAGMKLIPPAIGAFITSYVALLTIGAILAIPCSLAGYDLSKMPDLIIPITWALLFVLSFLFWNSKRTRKELMEAWAFYDDN